MVYGTRGVVVGLLLTLAAGPGCGGGSGNNGGRDGGSSTSDLGRRDGGGVCQPTPVTTAAVNASPPGPSTSPGELFDGRCGAAVGQLFPPSAPWNQSVRDTCVDPGSDAIIRYLDAVVDGGQTFRIDLGNSDDNYGFNPLAANASTDTYSFTPTDDFYDTHCDPVPIPVPSTGRLVRFAPPAETMFAADTSQWQGVRVDTGVQEGGEIPMYYDSMIAKLIVHGKDRQEAIAKMRFALDGFVIRGISSNIPFQAALLSHPDFVSGSFNTGFIATHYAQGFRAEDVPHADPDFLVALAAFVRRKSRERAMAISGQLPGYGVKVGHDFSVITLDDTGQHRYTRVHVDEVVGQLGSAVVTLADKKYAITSHSRLNDICISGECNGQPFTAQIERGTPRNPLAMLVQHNGTRIETMVVSPRMAELYQKMPFKPAPDMSKYVLSPMPGLLVDVAVQVGQKVQAGERVAVIEAMKMENVLFAAADGIVGKVLAAKGDNLTVDQPIVEFA